MQNDRYECHDEVEPRRMPRQASTFDSRPFPMVPEVSLIMDRPRQIKTIDDPLSNSVPELRSINVRDPSSKASESYAAWKEKQFPQQSIKVPFNHKHELPHGTSNYQNTDGFKHSTRLHNSLDTRQFSQQADKISPNRSHQIHSSTQNNSNYQDSRSFRQSTRLHHSPDTREFSQQISKISPNRSHQIHSSTQNNDNLHDTRGFKDSPKSCNSLDCRDPHCQNQSPRNESPDRHSIPRRFGQQESSNKYTLSYAARNNNENNHHVYDSHDFGPRSCNGHERTSPGDRRQSDHPHNIDTYDVRQKSRTDRLPSYSNGDSYDHRTIPIEYDYHPSYSRAAVQYNPDNGHRYPYYTSSHNHSNVETETVRNLLQVITSQNEQIKNLQKQVERLLKLHEQSLKSQRQCTCQPNGIVYQNTQLYDQSRTKNLPITHNSVMKENERCFSDLKLPDENSKKAILEQKVSIGVMTSFELKVQNNPSLAKDNENKQKYNQEKTLPSKETSNRIKNLVNDTGEMIRRKPNFFTHTPLENISEASESHLSSLRQSHLCADSTKQSIDAQDTEEVQTANFYKPNSHEIENLQSSSRQCMNQSSDRNVVHTKNRDRIKEPIYESANDIQEQVPYQYNFQYERLRSPPRGSSPHNSSPRVSSPDEGMKEKKTEEFNPEPLVSEITKMKNIKHDNFADECLSLSSSELDVEDPSPPSPEPSIHLDMQEYLSEEGSLPPQQGAKVGWTLYNNVLDQVNQILQNTPLNECPEDDSPNIRNNERKEYENNVLMDTVKAATLEQLTKLGISFSDNIEQKEPSYNKRVAFDTSYYPRQGTEAHLVATSANIETNTSMHMKALARKYLNDDQLSDMALQKSRPGTMKQTPNNVHSTNMSFATMHYLQRYHLLPGTNTSPVKEHLRDDYNRRQERMINDRLMTKAMERREVSPPRYHPHFTGSSKVSYPSKILDISTLKQQPKLL